MRTRRVTRRPPGGESNPTRADRARYARAREVGHREAADDSAVVDAWYDTQSRHVGFEFRSGARVLLPQRLVAGLEHASVRDLVTVSVSPAGDALSWRALDVDVAISGLVERALGKRLFESITSPAIEPVPEAQSAVLAPSEILTEADAARYIVMSAGWLKKSRTRSFSPDIDAPAFVRAGAKRVVYRRRDLDEWLERNVHRRDR